MRQFGAISWRASAVGSLSYRPRLYLTMKYNKAVSSSRRKNRKAHFSAPSSVRRVIMSAPVTKDQRKKLGVRSLPVRKGDEVQVTRGHYKGKDGKILKVYRKKWVIHIDKLTKDKANGATVHIGVHPSNVVITKPELDKDRKDLLERKTRHKEADKGKIKPAAMQTVE